MNFMDAYSVIKHPLSTEKAIRAMEAENKLLFLVDMSATKQDIKKSIEELFKVKVTFVNTLIEHGEKRAYVTLRKDYPAIDVAPKLGLM